MEREHSAEGSPIFDSLDIDLFVKVLEHTVFGPFFVFFIPVFYIFQGAKFTDPVVVISSIYWVFISLFWLVKWCSRLYRNQGSLFFGPGRFDWGEQIVVITGGSSGVGELLANTLAVRNVNVVVLDINPIVTENYNITYYKCDVSKWEEVKAVSKKVIEEIGEPTVLINNAGVVQGKLILDLKPEDVQQTFSVNTLAHFWTLKAFLPSMLKRKSGHIVTVASVMGYSSAVQMSDYSASKAAAIMLHESLRQELDIRYKCPQIRTTLVTPGHILTPLFKTLSVPNTAFYKFFFPSVQPITVVKRIIAALDEQHSQQISVPFYTNFVPYQRHLPSFLHDFVGWIAHANYAMERFEKVSGRRPDEGASKDD
ncbi:putative short-chain dehydrogenases reductases (SDR) family protein [Lyophyllum shimeji]|uniref:Short-chain dehydrogenase/reductase 3 n=1 Tax=Lyophyllum shimeji TaxID=47721 RepID=A0A9P3PEJ9_LYOSH|nr:putative short-chain dehydrogenases reductases (SDR) family protein [Lyophyllum shimeji]